MTREKKIEQRKANAFKRKNKKVEELKLILGLVRCEGIPFSRARDKVRNNGRGRYFECEMRYGDCEERGYCNGDC
jgi:hypothetical protein